MRGRVRRLAVLACSALLAAGCASAARPGLAAGAVPWVNRPAPVFTPSPQPSPTAAYPACRAWQLTGRPGRGGPAAGTVYQEVRLTNYSGRPCTLSGGPSTVTGVRANGRLVTLAKAAHADGWNLAGPGPANLRPGRSGWVTLAYADGCPALVSGGRAGYKTLLIALHGGQVRVRFRAPLNLICGLLVSDFGAPAAPPPGSISPLNVLAVTVTIPAVTAGTTASYSVTVHNTGGKRVALFPCPSYTQYLAIAAGNARTVAVQQHFYLNCAAVRQIPAHGSVTFAMRIAVPATPGRAKYDWQLQDTDVATAGGLTVRAPKPPKPAAAADGCTAAQLSAALEGSSEPGTGGTALASVYLWNNSATACTLPGPMTVIGLDQAGRQVTTPVRFTTMPGSPALSPRGTGPSEPGRDASGRGVGVAGADRRRDASRQLPPVLPRASDRSRHLPHRARLRRIDHHAQRQRRPPTRAHPRRRSHDLPREPGRPITDPHRAHLTSALFTAHGTSASCRSIS